MLPSYILHCNRTLNHASKKSGCIAVIGLRAVWLTLSFMIER